jgi:deoxyribose-phosphate aldolase
LTSDGKATLNKKLEEAQKAIENGADDLDFVCNYEVFKMVISIWSPEEILKGTIGIS